MTRGGRAKDRDGPERRCIVSGTTGDTDRMIRFVVGPDARVVPDLAGKLPGRGIWVTSDRAMLAKAVQKGLFSRAAKQKVHADADLADQVEALMARRMQDLIALSRKAGQAVAGFEKTRSRLLAGGVGALIEAFDGAEGGKAKLKPMAQTTPMVECLSGNELGLAFGRDNVIHAALESGALTDRLLTEAARLYGLRQLGPQP